MGVKKRLWERDPFLGLGYWVFYIDMKTLKLGLFFYPMRLPLLIVGEYIGKRVKKISGFPSRIERCFEDGILKTRGKDFPLMRALRAEEVFYENVVSVCRMPAYCFLPSFK